jgi:hypothetical protein
MPAKGESAGGPDHIKDSVQGRMLLMRLKIILDDDSATDLGSKRNMWLWRREGIPNWLVTRAAALHQRSSSRDYSYSLASFSGGLANSGEALIPWRIMKECRRTKRLSAGIANPWWSFTFDLDLTSSHDTDTEVCCREDMSGTADPCTKTKGVWCWSILCESICLF